MYTMRLLLPFTFLLHVTLLHLIMFLLLSVNAQGSEVLCTEKERRALLDFKLSFLGDPDFKLNFLGVPGNSLSTWSIHNDDCCDWDGVTCANHTGYVISLDLGGYYDLKSYELRPSILELQHLRYLDLSFNTFSMRIPKFIGSLSKLTHLILSDSGFFGEIPPQLANLSRLQHLDLSSSNGLHSNNLQTNNLQWLSHVSSIEYLDMSHINLSNATDWASTLKRLPVLSSFSCESCSPPQTPLSSLSHFNFSTSLQYLDVSNNNMMPSSTISFLINGTNNLQTLYLNNGKLEYNHDEILEALIETARYSLVVLSLSGNNLSKLPSQVSMFPSLRELYASSNRISGSLPEILQYLPANLTYLDLSSNLLNDVISDAHFSKFFQLNTLALSDNKLLTFNFSKSWVPPFQLDSLYLSSCKVGPGFPNWILTQKNLQDLDISNSMISGAIPDAFWHNCSGLRYLNISHNKINSMIPDLSQLLWGNTPEVDLSSNSFHGLIPRFMFNANTLDLSQNKFSSFPPFLHPSKLFTILQLINLSRNRLTGSLPNWLFQFDELSVLNLENNNLSGTLPRAVGSLYQLNALHLSNNGFSGELPYSMKNCTELAILELENNKFTGAVPSWLGEQMTQLIVLNLRSNDFSKDLPSSLCHLQSLQILDLSNNNLSGLVPACLYNFSSMATKKGLSITSTDLFKFAYFFTNKYVILLDYASVIWKGELVDLYTRNLEQRSVINLSGNKLSGEIPIGVTALKELKTLDLSRNYLNGSIPDKIGQLTSLELLKLSSNRLCGEIPESLASLTFLGTLNLSNNNLSGRIPTGTQLRGFDASSYAGNPNLCGQPLCKCPGDDDDDDNDVEKHIPSNKGGGDEKFDVQAFLAALGMGFAFGLLGVLGTLHFNRQFRFAFFQLVHDIADRSFVTTSLCKSRIKRSLNLP